MAYERGRIPDEGTVRLRERIGEGFRGRAPWRPALGRAVISHATLASCPAG